RPYPPHGHLGGDGWRESSRRWRIAGGGRVGQSSSAHRLIGAPHVPIIQTRSSSTADSSSPQRSCSWKKAEHEQRQPTKLSGPTIRRQRSDCRKIRCLWSARVHSVPEADSLNRSVGESNRASSGFGGPREQASPEPANDLRDAREEATWQSDSE